MRPIVFHAAAAREVQRARARYDEVDPALSEAFIQELEYVLQLAQRFPESGHPWPNDPGRRVFLLDRFPYRVVIRLRAEQARQLTEEERRELAIELLKAGIDPGIEQAWAAEVQRRVAEVESGEVKTIPHDEAWRMITSGD